MRILMLLLALAVSGFAQNTDPTSLIVGIQKQTNGIGGNLSIPLHRFNIATSGVHLDAVVKNKQASSISDEQVPVYESYSLGYYVDYGRTFISFGYNYYKEASEITMPMPIGTTTQKIDIVKHGAYAKLGLHGKYVGVFVGYSTASKASAGLMFFIPF